MVGGFQKIKMAVNVADGINMHFVPAAPQHL
jgi:hypothetical protein